MNTPATFPTNATLMIQNAALARACAIMATALRLNTTNGENWPEGPHEVMERVRGGISHLPMGSLALQTVDDILSDTNEDDWLYDQEALLMRYPSLQNEPGQARS